jgi:hypothetical protein
MHKMMPFLISEDKPAPKKGGDNVSETSNATAAETPAA